VFFYNLWTAVFLCVVNLGKWWHQDALWDNSKPVGGVWCSRQCFTGKPWVRPLMWIQIQPKNCCRPGAPLLDNGGSDLFQQDKAPCHTAPIVQECFEDHDEELM